MIYYLPFRKNYQSSIIPPKARLAKGGNGQFQLGFTLIELLITIVVLMAVGSIIGSILVSTMRGAATVSTINTVRQNGNSAITQMTKMIRFSQKFEGVSMSAGGPYTCDTVQTAWCTACSADIDKNGRVAVNDTSIMNVCRTSGIGGTYGTGQSCSNADINKDGIVDTTDSSCVTAQFGNFCNSTVPGETQYKFLKITGFDGGVTTFACENNTIASISAGQTTYLIDDTEVAFTTAGTCHFTCIKSDSFPPTIGIKFTLQRKQAQPGFFENQAFIPFQTSITPRNFY